MTEDDELIIILPESIKNWFKNFYPTLKFDEIWLKQCYNYLKNNFQLTNSQLIKKIENQLFLSDLSISTISLNDNDNDRLIPLNILINSKFEDYPKEILIFDKSILLQIQSITEIGHSALSLEAIHQKRLQDAQGKDRALDLDDEELEGPKAPPTFPRSMLKLELSDGRNVVEAIEYQRIEQLSLADTPLGSKLLLKSVKVRRGLLLLTPQNTTIKDSRVEELDLNRDEIFQKGLDVRLGRQTDQPVPQVRRDIIQAAQINIPLMNSANSASIINTNDSAPTRPEIIELTDSDDYFDDNSEFEAQLLAHDI